jgi:hypothetical protein
MDDFDCVIDLDALHDVRVSQNHWEHVSMLMVEEEYQKRQRKLRSIEFFQNKIRDRSLEWDVRELYIEILEDLK